jgi:hypothetical protein
MLGQDSENRTARAEQEQDSQKRTVITVQPEQKARKGELRKYCHCGTSMKVQPGQDNEDGIVRTAKKGLSGQD